MAQIFISYAREDQDKVSALYAKLKDAGFTPWIDVEDITAGEDWERAILKAMSESHFIVACISPHFVGKRGFIQREIKISAERYQEMLPDDILIIPVRLEDCPAPEELRKFQWVDLFKESGWPRLLKALDVGAERRGIELKSAPTESKPAPLPLQTPQVPVDANPEGIREEEGRLLQEQLLLEGQRKARESRAREENARQQEALRQAEQKRQAAEVRRLTKQQPPAEAPPVAHRASSPSSPEPIKVPNRRRNAKLIAAVLAALLTTGSGYLFYTLLPPSPFQPIDQPTPTVAPSAIASPTPKNMPTPASSPKNTPPVSPERLAAEAVGRARRLFAQGHYDRAIPFVDRALELDPGNREARKLKGKLEEASKLFK